MKQTTLAGDATGRPRRWTVDDIRGWPEARQLSLDVYMARYIETYERLFLRWFYSENDGFDSKALTRDATFAATRAALYDGVPSWGVLRRLIYERDEGVCHGCRESVPFELYECGHLLDRAMGGLDTPDNLVAMCYRCNRWKELHETKSGAERWCDDGGSLPAFIRVVQTALQEAADEWGLTPAELARRMAAALDEAS